MITFKDLGYLGRLGNQIFQYAMLFVISKKTGYEIGLFESNEALRPGSVDLSTNQWIHIGFELHRLFDLTYKPVTDASFIQNEYKEKQTWIYDAEVFNIQDNTSIYGFFQNEKYFSKYKNELTNEFKFKIPIKKYCFEKLRNYKNGEDIELVSIHVRRGDTLGHPLLMSVCTPEYYQTALEQFSDKPYKFLIFSDDIPWCKENFGEDENIFYVDNADTNIPAHFLDLCLMSMCDHNILAPSSFSWWAAWLNTNKNKRIVCSANPWPPTNTPEYYPNEWIKI